MFLNTHPENRKGQGKNDRKMVFRFKDGTEVPMTI